MLISESTVLKLLYTHRHVHQQLCVWITSLEAECSGGRGRIKVGSNGDPVIPSTPHKMVSATCPAEAGSGRLAGKGKIIVLFECTCAEGTMLTALYWDQDPRWCKVFPLYCELVDHHWSPGGRPLEMRCWEFGRWTCLYWQ